MLVVGLAFLTNKHRREGRKGWKEPEEDSFGAHIEAMRTGVHTHTGMSVQG
jgi:hypothetical protein